MHCTHREGGTTKNGQRVDKHDCDYVEVRKLLITEAERIANTRHGVELRRYRAGECAAPPSWPSLFMVAMQELWRARGERLYLERKGVARALAEGGAKINLEVARFAS